MAPVTGGMLKARPRESLSWLLPMALPTNHRSPGECRQGRAASLRNSVNRCTPPMHGDVIDLDTTFG